MDRIDAPAESGFDSLEFWGWRSKDIKGILEGKEKYRLALSTFSVEPMGRIVDSSVRHEFITGGKDTIDIAHKLECPRHLVTTGNEIEGILRRTQHKSIVKSLKEAAKLVEKADVTLLLEPLNLLVDHRFRKKIRSRITWNHCS